MNKTKIMNTYAIEQGYESWERLVYWYITSSDDRLIYHLNTVTDLIKEELLLKQLESFVDFYNNRKLSHERINYDEIEIYLNEKKS